MLVTKFISIWKKYGDILNILYTLGDNDHSTCTCDYLEEYGTSCCTTTDTLEYLLTDQIPYYETDFHHNILNNMTYPSLLTITLNDIAEPGSHYMSVIATNSICYLIQSSEMRYTAVITSYPSLKHILIELGSMLYELQEEKKIQKYNILTHNFITSNDYNVFHDTRYQRDEVINIKAYNLHMITNIELKEWILNILPKIQYDVLILLQSRIDELLEDI